MLHERAQRAQRAARPGQALGIAEQQLARLRLALPEHLALMRRRERVDPAPRHLLVAPAPAGQGVPPRIVSMADVSSCRATSTRRRRGPRKRRVRDLLRAVGRRTRVSPIAPNRTPPPARGHRSGRRRCLTVGRTSSRAARVSATSRPADPRSASSAQARGFDGSTAGSRTAPNGPTSAAMARSTTPVSTTISTIRLAP